MPYTEEMTTSEILLRLASMRNELLQVVNDIEKISKNICYKAEQTESSSEISNNCDTCRFELYCPEMCEGCCEWDSHYEPKDEVTISKMEQVDKDIYVRSKTEPQYDIGKGTIRCDNCAENGSYKCSKCDGEIYFKRLAVKDEPQTCSVNGRPYSECSSCERFRCTADEPQTDCPWK